MINGFLEGFQQRREALDKGKLTYLPIHDILPRMSTIFPGFIPEDYVLITGASGAGKSRFTRFLFVKHVINLISMYGINAHIFYNSTEESLAKIEATFIQSYLWRKYQMDLKFYDLMQYVMPSNKLPDATVRKIMEAKEMVDKKIRPYMTLYHEHDGYTFYKKVISGLAKRGQFYNEEGSIIKTGEKIGSYSSEDPYAFNIVISDNINNYSAWEGKNHETTLRNFSELYCRNVLNLKCKAIVVNVQQQVGDKERADTNLKTSQMAEKLYPSKDGLAHCTHTQRDATVMLGIFKPHGFARVMPTYGGYPVAQTKGLTGIHILKTRESEPTIANIVPVNHLPGDTFVELPKI